MTRHKTYSHFGIFILLFIFSTLRAESLLPNMPVSFSSLALLLLCCGAFWQVHRIAGLKNFFSKHRSILLLIAAYQLLCFITLLLNRDSYSSNVEFIRWGVTFIAVQSALPLAAILFLLGHNEQFSSLTSSKTKAMIFFTFFTALFGLGIWQSVDFSSSQNVTQFFIASELKDTLTLQDINQETLEVITAENISSLFAIRTDFGAVAATASLSFLFIFLLKRKTNNARFLFIALACICVVAGLLSGARVFLLAISIGLSYLFLKILKKCSLSQASYLISLGGLLLALTCLVLPMHTATRLSVILPAIAKMNMGLPLYANDFLLSINASILSGRDALWAQAVQLILENPFIGVSNGVFRLHLDSVDNGGTFRNTHNIFIQSLVDAGVIGFTLFVGIWFSLFKMLKNTPYSRVLFFAITTSLLVDNFIDHSLPWIIISTYLFSIVYQQEQCTENSNENTKLTKTFDFFSPKLCGIVISSLFCVVCIIYTYRVKEFESTPTHEQLQSINLFTAPDMSESDDVPVMISEHVAEKIKAHRRDGINKYLTSVENPCDYSYPNGAYYHTEKKYIKENSLILSDGLNQLYFTPTNAFQCRSSISNPFDFKHWISNHWDFLNHQRNYINPSDSITIRYHDITMWTPVFDGTINKELKFNAHGLEVNGIAPTLRVALFDATNGSIEKVIDKAVPSKGRKISIALPSQKIYLKFQLINYQTDLKNRKYQSVTITRI